MACTITSIINPGGSSSSSTVSNFFVFQPLTLSPGGNVYNNWALLYADLVTVRGTRQIDFVATNDTKTVTLPIHIPAGTYDMTGTIWNGIVNGFEGPNVIIDNNCFLPNLLNFGDSIFVIGESDSPIISLPSGGIGKCGFNCNIGGSALTALYDMTGNNFFLFLVGANSTVSIGNGGGFISLAASATFIPYMLENATVDQDSIYGDVTTSIFAFVTVGSADFNTTQTGMLGAISAGYQDVAFRHFFDNTITGFLTANDVQAAIDEICALLAFADTPRLGIFDAKTNTTTGETTLISKVMPAGDLKNIYEGYYIRAGGSFASNANAKQVRLYFGATVICNSASSILYNNGRWWIEARLFRNTGTAQVGIAYFFSTFTTIASTSARTTPGETMSGAITIRVTGQGAATADIQQDFMDITKIIGGS